jgi:HEPN domain-containing protein
MSAAAKNWLAFAREDLQMAALALQEDIFNQACFHAQQCAEKSVKALLEFRGTLPPRTHRLADLVALLAGPDRAKLPEQELLLLDRFYIPTRYPDALPGTLPTGLPQRPDANQARELAQAVFDAVSTVLKDGGLTS